MLLSKQKLIVFGAALLLSLSVQADSLMPDVPKAKRKYSEKTLCVKSKDEMRKNHMHYILHQRDETLRKGIRTTQLSLKECIDCHNAPAEDGKVASADTSEHFCSSCHTYAAVSIDCFSCHNDKPANTQYRHSLSDKNPPPQGKFADKDVDTETLEHLAVKGEQK